MIINSQMEKLAEPRADIIVAGKQFGDLPKDLYIPPDALEILLDSFSGPMDLLLYLIRKQNIDILDIPIHSITKQYLVYIEYMGFQRLELAADYLVMAAMLAEIKSRMLLPLMIQAEEEEQEDPRMALVRRLQTYEAIKQVSEALDTLPRQDRDTFTAQVEPTPMLLLQPEPEVTLVEITAAWLQLLKKADALQHHSISRESLSVQDRMQAVLLQLQSNTLLELKQLFYRVEGVQGLVVSFLAILELARLAVVTITQVKPFSSVYIEGVGT